ncbi:MAG: hypothetical protein V1704_02450 [Candidatus Vogelbacteria bacterium]
MCDSFEELGMYRLVCPICPGPQQPQDRVEHGTQFRAVIDPPFDLPSHWVVERGKPVMVISAEMNHSSHWIVYAPLSGSGRNGINQLVGEDAEERAFAIAVSLANQM